MSLIVCKACRLWLTAHKEMPAEGIQTTLWQDRQPKVQETVLSEQNSNAQETVQWNRWRLKSSYIVHGWKNNTAITSPPQPHQKVQQMMVQATGMRGSYPFNKLHGGKWEQMSQPCMTLKNHHQDVGQQPCCKERCATEDVAFITWVHTQQFLLSNVSEQLRVWEFVPCSSTNEVVDIASCVQHNQLLPCCVFIKPHWRQSTCPAFQKMPLKSVPREVLPITEF